MKPFFLRWASSISRLRQWLLLTPRIQDYEAHDKTQTEIWLRYFANDIVEQT
jgi:hypothetical protein